ncbi:MAG: HAD-IA family hydrolase [Candidatus Hydrogenedentes bacterium]|nr:HAD-IA family hydrolase [Candidatus Hydrogenedentota bacterium]
MITHPDFKAVLLDAAGTLLTVDPSVGHVYADHAALYGFNVCANALNESFVVNWRAHRHRDENGSPFHTSEAGERSWWHTFALAVYSGAGASAEFRTEYNRIFDSLYKRFADPDVWRVYDDVVPGLDDLRERGVRLAVVSNWDSRLPLLLERLSLSDRFEFILTSAESGFSKPHPDIFVQACRRLNLSPEDVVHVGDSPEEDVDGAQAAGIRGVLLDREGRWPKRPDAIRALTDLVAPSRT